jgi:hypothetical protein
MTRINLFSNFYWLANCEEQVQLAQNYLPAMLDNHRHQKFMSPDWNMHTSYKNTGLKNPINWTEAKKVYSKYVDAFLLEFFGQVPDWSFQGDVWYNAYSSNQTADIHDHLPDHFSVVHFLKFNPEVHNPIEFVNPYEQLVKHTKKMSPGLMDCINRFHQDHSLYVERFMPTIQEGDIIVFPSNVSHGVPLSLSDEVRVTVAFNIVINGPSK